MVYGYVIAVTVLHHVASKHVTSHRALVFDQMGSDACARFAEQHLESRNSGVQPEPTLIFEGRNCPRQGSPRSSRPRDSYCANSYYANRVTTLSNLSRWIGRLADIF